MSSGCVYGVSPEMKRPFHYFHVHVSEGRLCIRQRRRVRILGGVVHILGEVVQARWFGEISTAVKNL